MIKNNTSRYSKKDFLYVTKSTFWNRRTILFAAVEFILGLFTLIQIWPWWKALYFFGYQIFSAKDMLFLIFCSGVSLLIIACPFLMPYHLSISYYRKQAASKEKSAEIEFGEESIIGRFANEGVCGENRFGYSVVDGYEARNNAVYIRLMVGKSKEFLILHDDAYLEGSKEELIEFLEGKGIKSLQKNKK